MSGSERPVAWRKSSYSTNGGNCLEWAPALIPTGGAVPVRDSKNPDGPVLHFPPTAWTRFVCSSLLDRAAHGA
ncbi:DUF397 domain-containing protein [Streptomyces sp. NPDC049577]|uniref:DUF397 domain-containing protein n=1 Tax=Streptomyces sp. NPDC049577 TaxID=3155153 RepID=UPI0034480D2C